jgi:hypothetical protein
MFDIIIEEGEENEMTNSEFGPLGIEAPTATTQQYLFMLLMFLNQQIGAQTTANYKITPVTFDFKIKIPINVYTAEDTTLPILKLVEKRIHTIKTFLEDFDFNTAPPDIQFIVRELNKNKTSSNQTNKLNIKDNFIMHVKVPNINYERIISLKMNFDIVKQVKMRRDIFSDESSILYYIDPLLLDYGVYVDLSVPFVEMGFGYNYLHLFEHLMTKAWTGIRFDDNVIYNGFTFPNGICCVYHCQNQLEDHLKISHATIEWMTKCRELNFWNLDSAEFTKKHLMNKNKESQNRQRILNPAELIKETTRTISETSHERTFLSMGRSDPFAYTFNYDTKIFEYWSNKPFSLLIVGKSEDIIIPKDNVARLIYNSPLNQVPIPKLITVFHIPREVLLLKSIGMYVIKKAEVDEIKRAFIEQDYKGFYGVDNIMLNMQNPLVSYKSLNSLCHVLLFNNRIFTNRELRDIVDSLNINRKVENWANQIGT